jgi:dipeptidyl aminopeptidase/acylaminoacyl peptidase
VLEDTSLVQLDSVAQTLTGKKVGTTKLTIHVEGFDPSSWTITVIPPGIALAPDRLALSREERQALAANMVDDGGRSVAPLTDGQWRSSDPAVVTVSPKGEVQGVGLGRAYVSVSGPGERTDTAEVFVVGDLLVSSDRGGRPGIYQLSLAHPDSLVPLVADTVIYQIAAYSPDRTRIALASARDRRLTVSVMEAGGHQSPRAVLRLVGSKPALAWMPDGQHLVFAVGDKRRVTLGMLDLDKTTWDTLLVVEDTLSPSVSADGTIVYARGDKNRADIYALKPPSRAVTRLTNTPYFKSDPRWLPGGDILFLMDDGREKTRYQIVRFNPKSGTQTVVVRSQEPILAFSVARDGRSLAYTIKEKNKRKPSSLFVSPTEPGGRARTILLRPGETVTALSY